MLFSDTEDLEDRIVKLTLGAPASISSLHARLNSEEPLSLRAVYKSVDKLVKGKILIKAGKRVVVDEEWVRRVGERLQTSPISVPAQGERVVYTFVSMEHADAFWKTVILPLEESLKARETFFYNPHNFWSYLPERAESDKRYFAHFKDTNRYGFLTIGGEFEADNESKKHYQSEHFQIDTRNIGVFRRIDHFTVLGPLIITGRLSKRTAARIDDLYASNRSIKDILPELLAICRAPGNIKFVIENNPLKAQKLKRLLARNFYFPQQK